MTHKKIFRNPIFIAFIFIIAYFLLASFWGFYTIIKPPKIISNITPETLGLDYEDISFTTADNLTLRGWWIPSKTEEAGGKVTDLNGKERRYDEDGWGCILSNGILHDEILGDVQKGKLK